MSCSFDYGDRHVVSNLDAPTSRQLVDDVLAGALLREKVFRDNWRTLSAKVRFQDDSLLLKVPRARNGRRWERFLTRFRESDALRTFRHIEQLSAMGFGTPEPVLACECRHHGVVVDSFVCYRFVDGRPAGPQDADKILQSLRTLHRRGLLRSDAQLANFLMVRDEVTFIDFRLKRPRWLPQLQKAREIDRFLRSCPEARECLAPGEASSFWLRLASGMEAASFGFRNLKRTLRRRKRKTG